MRPVPHVITGFSREFLEKELGLKKMEFPLVEASIETMMPLEPVKLAYEIVQLNSESSCNNPNKNHRGVE